MSHVLVTGGAGFIGSHLVDRLLSRGEKVSIVDSFDDGYDSATKRRNIEAALGHSTCRLYECDIRSASALDAAWCRETVDVVVHLAARGDTRASVRNPTLYADINVKGTINVLEAARKRGCRRFVFAGSSSVYGNSDKLPLHEEGPLGDPLSPYAATKRAGETLCSTYHRVHGLPITCLRLFSTYGPRCRPDMAVARFMRLIDDGKPVPMFGDGSMQRDLTYVDDVVDGLIRAIEHHHPFRTFNLAAARPIQLREMIAAIGHAMDKRPVIEQHPRPPGDTDKTHADITRARAELGYAPAIDFERGVERYVRWYQDTCAAV